MNIKDFRTSYPQYDGVDDATLAGALHQKFYPDVPKDLFFDKFGVTPPTPDSSVLGELGRGAVRAGREFMSGVLHHPANLAMSALGNLTGSQAIQDTAASDAAAIKSFDDETQREYAAAVPTLASINNAGDAAKYAASALGAVPVMGAQMVLTGMPGMVAAGGIGGSTSAYERTGSIPAALVGGGIEGAVMAAPVPLAAGAKGIVSGAVRTGLGMGALGAVNPYLHEIPGAIATGDASALGHVTGQQMLESAVPGMIQGAAFGAGHQFFAGRAKPADPNAPAVEPKAPAPEDTTGQVRISTPEGDVLGTAKIVGTEGEGDAQRVILDRVVSGSRRPLAKDFVFEPLDKPEAPTAAQREDVQRAWEDQQAAINKQNDALQAEMNRQSAIMERARQDGDAATFHTAESAYLDAHSRVQDSIFGGNYLPDPVIEPFRKTSSPVAPHADVEATPLAPPSPLPESKPGAVPLAPVPGVHQADGFSPKPALGVLMKTQDALADTYGARLTVVTADAKTKKPSLVLRDATPEEDAHVASVLNDVVKASMARSQSSAGNRPEPSTFAQWVAREGGVAGADGEMKARDAQLWHKRNPGWGGLIKPTVEGQGDLMSLGAGRNKNSIDDLVTRAIEQRWLPEGSGPREFFAKLDAALGGKQAGLHPEKAPPAPKMERVAPEASIDAKKAEFQRLAARADQLGIKHDLSWDARDLDTAIKEHEAIYGERGQGHLDEAEWEAMLAGTPFGRDIAPHAMNDIPFFDGLEARTDGAPGAQAGRVESGAQPRADAGGPDVAGAGDNRALGHSDAADVPAQRLTPEAPQPDMRGKSVGDVLDIKAQEREMKVAERKAEAQRQDEIKRLEKEQSALRKGGQRSAESQPDGLFAAAAKKDQGDLLSGNTLPKAEAPKAKSDGNALPGDNLTPVKVSSDPIDGTKWAVTIGGEEWHLQKNIGFGGDAINGGWYVAPKGRDPILDGRYMGDSRAEAVKRLADERPEPITTNRFGEKLPPIEAPKVEAPVGDIAADMKGRYIYQLTNGEKRAISEKYGLKGEGALGRYLDQIGYDPAKAEAPKAEAPKAEAPKAEAPKAEASENWMLSKERTDLLDTVDAARARGDTVSAEAVKAQIVAKDRAYKAALGDPDPNIVRKITKEMDRAEETEAPKAEQPPFPETAKLGHGQEYPADITRVADTHMGHVVYSEGEGKLGLVQTYDTVGNTHFLPARGSEYATLTRRRDGVSLAVDIDSYTGKMFTPAERERLVAAKAAIQKEEAVKAAARPEGPFQGSDKQVVGTDKIDSKLVDTVNGWARQLGIEGRVFLAHPDDVSSPDSWDRYGLHGDYDRARSAAVNTQNAGGATGEFKNRSDAFITFKGEGNRQAQLEVLAHELGHIVERQAIRKASPEEIAGIKTAYERWAKGTSGKTAGELVESSYPQEFGKHVGGDRSIPAENLPPYWRSFNEWFANQTARWATTSEKPVTVVGKFFASLAQTLRKLAGLANGKYLPEPEVKAWLDARVEKSQAAEAFRDAVNEDPIQQMAMSFKADENIVHGTPEQEQAISRAIGKHENKNLFAKIKDWGKYLFHDGGFRHEIIDSLESVKRLELALNDRRGKGRVLNEGDESDYKMATKVASNSSAYLKTLMLGGMLRMNSKGGIEYIPEADAAYNPRFKGGYLGILGQLHKDGKDYSKLFGAWKAGLRAQRLIQEGRERLMDQPTIDELVAIGKDHTWFEQVDKDLDAFRKGVLDFARQTGMFSDAQFQALHDTMDYVPFNRILDADGNIGGPGTGKESLGNQSSGIFKLTGGAERYYVRDGKGDEIGVFKTLAEAKAKADEIHNADPNAKTEIGITGLKLNDPIENMINNITSITTRSLRNYAGHRIIDAAVDAGFATKAKWDGRVTKHSPEVLQEKLEDLGVMMPSLTQAQKNALVSLYQPEPPKGSNIVSIVRGGKAEYYEIHDTMLHEALSRLPAEQLGSVLKVFNWAKQALTGSVAIEPGFMLANLIRDTMEASFLSGVKGFVPLVDSVKGAVKALNGDEVQWKLLGSGGAPSSFQGMERGGAKGFVNQAAHGSRSRLPLGIGKALDKYLNVAHASEMSTRIGAYEKAVQSGDSPSEAAYKSLMILNFGRHGANQHLNTLLATVPFMNARLQGLDNIARAVENNPKRLMLMGSMMAIASLANLANNYNDPDYWAQPDWRRDTNWLFKVNGKFYAMPKPFELGSLFGSVAERLATNFAGRVTGDPKEPTGKVAHTLGRLLGDVLNFTVIPQAVKPLWELKENKVGFSDASIVPEHLKKLNPSERYSAVTSDTAVAVTRGYNKLSQMFESATGLDTPEASPMQTEYLVRAYFGQLGMYALDATDMILRGATNAPSRPSMRVDEMPVLRRFVQDPYAARSTQDRIDFQQTRAKVEQLYNTIKRLEKLPGMQDRAAEYRLQGETLLALRSSLEDTNKVLAGANTQEQQIRMRTDMTSAEKRKAIDEIKDPVNRRVHDTNQAAWKYMQSQK